jgi:hypothetical protein
MTSPPAKIAPKPSDDALSGSDDLAEWPEPPEVSESGIGLLTVRLAMHEAAGVVTGVSGDVANDPTGEVLQDELDDAAGVELLKGVKCDRGWLNMTDSTPGK